jgi:hypothetical protein
MVDARHSMYLVERYWPAVTAEQVREALARLAAVAAPDRDTARHLGSVLVPADECVFSLFLARSSAAVAAANRAAGVPFDRVAPAVCLPYPSQP